MDDDSTVHLLPPEFSDPQAQVEGAGWVRATENELEDEGAIREGHRLWVCATKVALEDGSPWLDPDDPLPILRVLVADEGHRPLQSFAIEKDLAKDALVEFAHPSMQRARVLAPAFVDERVRPGVIRRGAERYLTMTLIPLDGSDKSEKPNAAVAIRFELADEGHRPQRSFTMDWPRAFLLINAARPEHG